MISTYIGYCIRSTLSYVYVHGHSAGGTNPSLVEMMHFEKPIIAFDCVYNRATMEDKGQYFLKLLHRYPKMPKLAILGREEN